MISTADRNQKKLLEAFAAIKDRTCIRLVPRKSQWDYIIFNGASSKCNSYVGKIGGDQTVSLKKNS